MNNRFHLIVGEKCVISKPILEEIEFTFIGGEPPRVQTKNGIYTFEELWCNHIKLKET